MLYKKNKSVIFITGMSGTGKSAVLSALEKRGYRTIDTDTGAWCVDLSSPESPIRDWVWDEQAIQNLLDEHKEGILFIAGCVSNQGKFYSQFDEIILLTLPTDILLARITARTENQYGKSEQEQAEILHNIAEIEPLLRKGSTIILDTHLPLAEVVNSIETSGLSHIN